MKTSLLCTVCFAKNAVTIAKKVTGDPALQERIVRQAMTESAAFDYSVPPPEIARNITRIAVELSGTEDPYLAEKDASTELAKRLLKGVLESGKVRKDNFESLVRLSAAGNIIDFGVDTEFDFSKAVQSVETAFTKPVDTAAVARLEQAMARARKILFITDNCGEAVFDRMLVELYREKVVLAVRGRPILNDVTRREAKMSGLDAAVSRIIDTGDCTPGISFRHSSPEFLQEFQSADLVIAKGQGNFETLTGCGRPLAMLFMAKCPAVCREIGAKLYSLQVHTENL